MKTQTPGSVQGNTTNTSTTLTAKTCSRKSLRQILLKYWKLLTIAPSSTLLVAVMTWTGLLQGLEWKVLDVLLQLRPAEPPDPRIVIVTIDDKDISRAGNWPISDRVLTDVLLKLKEQKPRVIGLDIYRDLPVEPGHQQLVNLFNATPNLIGVEKRFGSLRVPAPPTLAQKGQVAISDIVEDPDQTVRRGLLAARDDQQDQIYLGLATKLALTYLEAEGIKLEAVEGSQEKRKLGQAQFTAFSQRDGGYRHVDDFGYQVLLNFRSGREELQTIPLTAVLDGQVPKGALRDRIVLIGSIAESINDDFITPIHHSVRDPETQELVDLPRTPGVFVHANLTSQIISAALYGRPFIQVLPDALELLWIFSWSCFGVFGVWQLTHRNRSIGQLFYTRVVLGIAFISGGLFVIHYLAFVGVNLWVPFIAPLVGLSMAAIASCNFYNEELFNFAYLDGLTQVANRRYFEQILTRHGRLKGDLSLILCDIDFFKNYNDTYGHQAGDACLKQVATAIRHAVRQTDIVARYGGEEFAVVLPRTNGQAALQVAERIVRQVRELKLVHASSQVSDYVTLSCGVSTVMLDEQLLQNTSWTPFSLVTQADELLYLVKKNGRNQAMFKITD